MKPVIQVALDFVDLQRALNVAQETIKGGADWLEAGTPLIKSEGLNSVRELKKRFPGKKIIADLKVMDTGRYEVEAASKAGADIVVVLGVADNSTIKEAVDAGKNYGCEIMVDLLNVENLEKRAQELEKLNVNYICVHLGIDQQMRGLDPIKELRKISGKVKIPLAAAGGINSENAAEAVNAGASIVIVGGAITKAENAKTATEKIRNAIKFKKKIATELYKKYTDPVKIFKIVSTANISDAMHRQNVLEGIVQQSGEKIVGTAVTVRTYPGDWAKPVEAIELAQKDEVLVIDSGGVGPAIWGELASESAKRKNLAGVVVWGAIRDLEYIRKIKFAAFSNLVCSNAGEPKGFGEINVSLKISGVQIRQGDYIVADSDGVIVIPKEEAIEIANRALDVYEKENRVREEIRRGKTLSEVQELRKWEKIL